MSSPGATPQDFRRAREGSQAALQHHEVAWTTIPMLLRIHQTPQTHFKAQNAIFRQKLMLVMVQLVGPKAGRALGWQHLSPGVMPHHGDPLLPLLAAPQPLLTSSSEQLLGKVPTEAINATKVPHPSLGAGNTPGERPSVTGSAPAPTGPTQTAPKGTGNSGTKQSLNPFIPTRTCSCLWGTHSSWVPSPAVTEQQWWPCPSWAPHSPALLRVLSCSDQGGTARNAPHRCSPAPHRGLSSG